MDLLYHLVVGLILSKQMLGEYLFLVVLFSMLPDLLGTIHLQILHIKDSSKKSFKIFINEWRHHTDFHGKWDKLFYRTSHSLFFWLALSLGLYFITNMYLVLSLAYLSHIVIDIFTHDGAFAT